MFDFLIDKKSLKTLIFINGLFGLAANMFPAIFALFVEEIGGSSLEAGSIWATFAVVTGILTFIISRYADKIKEKEYLLAGGYFFRFLAWLGYFFTHSLPQMYTLQFLLASGEALGTSAFNAIYSEHLNKEKAIKQWGSWNSFFSIIVGISAFLGGLIVSQFGFRILFLLMSLLCLISFIILIIQPRRLL